MRNEIYARYGYIFMKGGGMNVYFRQQDWYKDQYLNVDKFLTNLEKANSKIIKDAESIRSK